MKVQPKEMGEAFAQTTDKDALYDEANSEERYDLLDETLKSFQIIFDENQATTVRGSDSRIQHDLLETALHQMLEESSNPHNMRKENMVQQARELARDTFFFYANSLLNDVDVSRDDIPDRKQDFFKFKNSIIEYYWNDYRPDIIENER